MVLPCSCSRRQPLLLRPYVGVIAPILKHGLHLIRVREVGQRLPLLAGQLQRVLLEITRSDVRWPDGLEVPCTSRTLGWEYSHRLEWHVLRDGEGTGGGWSCRQLLGRVIDGAIGVIPRDAVLSGVKRFDFDAAFDPGRT